MVRWDMGTRVLSRNKKLCGQMKRLIRKSVFVSIYFDFEIRIEGC